VINKLTSAVATVAALLALTACDPEAAKRGENPGKAPAAGQGQQHKEPGGQQPAPVQGDPSAHNTQPGELDLHVEWESENRKTPACEWSINKPGVGGPCANMATPHQVDGKGNYIGLWEHTTTAKSGDVVFLSAEGNTGTKWVECAVSWKGKYRSLGAAGQKRCGGVYTLP
jgi:hypothetical protein